MKIIFSRKGIDSSFGNCASPIMPDGRLCWMPIPEDNPQKPDLPTYAEVKFGNTTLGTIIEDLSSGKILSNRKVHLDPDIFHYHRERINGWKPVFGQTGAAESHLRNKEVEIDDIFLFFGWFRKSIIKEEKYKYESKAPDLHVMYGWLQIGEIVKISDMKEVPEWIKTHPHMLGNNYGKTDTLYIAKDKLILNGEITDLPGSGSFDYINKELILTAEGQTRSVWQLPTWAFPMEDKPPLSYNENKDKWSMDNEGVRVRIASRGQEFVLNADFYPEAIEWVGNLIKSAKK